MLRVVGAALQGTARTLSSLAAESSKCRISSILGKNPGPAGGFAFPSRHASILCSTLMNSKNEGFNNYSALFGQPRTSILSTTKLQVALVPPVRTVIKFSRGKGKRKTVKTVVTRFYRLNWGIWIRTKAGRHKHLWKKSLQRKRRLRRHVFTTAAQSWLLDKMVTKFWRKPKFYVDDPYNPYHRRENFAITRKEPQP